MSQGVAGEFEPIGRRKGWDAVLRPRLASPGGARDGEVVTRRRSGALSQLGPASRAPRRRDASDDDANDGDDNIVHQRLGSASIVREVPSGSRGPSVIRRIVLCAPRSAVVAAAGERRP